MPAMKIGCIGPSDSINLVTEVAARCCPDITLLTYVRERAEDSWQVLEQCQRETSGTLFTGIAVQEGAKARGTITNPYEHIQRGGYSLLRVLSEMNRKGIKSGRLSIDVVSDDILVEVVREFGVELEDIHSMPYALHLSEQEYLNRHIELYESGKVEAIATGFGYVYSELKKQGLPVFRLYASTLQIRDSLSRLTGRIKNLSLRSAGIAIQLVKLKSITRSSINQYDDMKNGGRFYLELLEYVRAIQGSLFNFGTEEYVIFATRGLIDSKPHREHFERLLSWGRERNIIFSSGIGIGATAFEAEKSARKALDNAVKLDKGGLFIVEGTQIRGPIGEEDELEYSTHVVDDKLLEMSKKIGISPSYLDKIRSLMDKTRKDTFDTSDFAACLGIGERSARRVLKKFLDSGFAEINGREVANQVGRPKKMVRLLI
ncbi:hypothetical protein [Maridesulfovibrio salexigens]|uniref:Transcriptional regulator n=1 Tax=Maridesulfovibrio salexigens (strain ATCC 14822 / DSM 2638 / NCIMB 8403 / VKM B-1763) TaxID=526222 RepID=C6BYM8_MARSD|nr:hypothetical protein [Maridesulfovibrio salexigens]ACS80635.1 conserved hypothetical protein [Maridesulfovibrio salexigens DSM 2638]